MAEDEQGDQEDKTEAPSQKRIDDAREKGDVPRSIEVNSWFILSAIAFIISIMANSANGSGPRLSGFLEHAGQFSVTQADMWRLSGHCILIVASYLYVPFAIAMVASLLGPMLQHFTTPQVDNLMPKLSRVSPMAGFARVFGKEALGQVIKSLAKLAIISGVVSIAVWGERDKLAALPKMELTAILDFARSALTRMLIAVLAIHAFVAGGDYLFQWFSWQKRLRMSHQDIKDEFKQQEGSPEVKNKLRQLRRNFARRAMMGKVPKATVVIANPTHFAVALQYEAGMRAPVCLAKGVDVLALRIRALAEDNNVPVIVDPPLARSLYRLVEIDEEIPLDLYKPVAEIIGYVMRLRQRRATRVPERQVREP